MGGRWCGRVAGIALAGCIGPGSYQVTPQLQNGTIGVGLWHSLGGDSCYWERLRGFSGSLDDIIANNISSAGPQYVDVKAGDAGFHTSGCSLWVQTDGPFDRRITWNPTTQQFAGDGEFRVGAELSAGRFQASTPADCYWERLAGFSGELSDIIANANGQGIVDISPTDVGFNSVRCGVWTKIG